MSAQAVKSGLVRHLFLLSVAALLGACSTTRTAPGPSIGDTPASETQSVLQQAAATFAGQLKASAADPGNGDKAVLALRSGRALLDLQCNRYLDALGLANQAASYERQQTGLVGGFVAAIMGLTGSTAKQVAGAATAFAFAGSSMDAFTSTYLFSDAAKSVTKIVRDSQSAFLGALTLDQNGFEYADAVAVLTGYEALCRPAHIRALIDDSVTKARIEADFTRPRASDGDTAAVLEALTAALGRRISEQQAINLYAWYLEPTARATGATTQANDPIPALKQGGLSDAELDRKLSQAFLPVSLAGSRVPARWSAAVARVLAAGSAAAPVAPPLMAPAPAPAIGVARPAAVPRTLAPMTLPVLVVR